MPDTEAKRSPRKKLIAYAIVALLVFLFFCVSFGWGDVVLRPWARSITGSPVLMDTWVGRMPVPGAAERTVTLELQRVPEYTDRGACAHCSRIEGRAKVCVPGTGVEVFSIRGDVDNWRGTSLSLNAAAPQRPPGTYINLGQLKGEWDLADTLRLKVTPHPVVINSDGSSTVTSSDSSPDVEVSFELRRAADAPSPPC